MKQWLDSILCDSIALAPTRKRKSSSSASSSSTVNIADNVDDSITFTNCYCPGHGLFNREGIIRPVTDPTKAPCYCKSFHRPTWTRAVAHVSNEFGISNELLSEIVISFLQNDGEIVVKRRKEIASRKQLAPEYMLEMLEFLFNELKSGRTVTSKSIQTHMMSDSRLHQFCSIHLVPPLTIDRNVITSALKKYANVGWGEIKCIGNLGGDNSDKIYIR
jgi:hypothetical protein